LARLKEITMSKLGRVSVAGGVKVALAAGVPVVECLLTSRRLP
jgi:hypothetical protein